MLRARPPCRFRAHVLGRPGHGAHRYRDGSLPVENAALVPRRRCRLGHPSSLFSSLTWIGAHIRGDRETGATAPAPRNDRAHGTHPPHAQRRAAIAKRAADTSSVFLRARHPHASLPRTTRSHVGRCNPRNDWLLDAGMPLNPIGSPGGTQRSFARLWKDQIGQVSWRIRTSKRSRSSHPPLR